jgi:hypothetical protein
MQVLVFGSAEHPMEYGERRDAARDAGCAVHLQFHFNAGGGKRSLTMVTNAADSRCRTLAAEISHAAADIFHITDDGVRTLARDDRGWVCIGDELSGIVLEPFFGDMAAQAAIAQTPQAREAYARAIADGIRKHYPADAKIALTLGHKYKPSNPDDRGASLVGGGDEASWNEPIIARIIALLTKPEAPKMNYGIVRVCNDDQKKGATAKLAALGGRWIENNLEPIDPHHYIRTFMVPDTAKFAEFCSWAKTNHLTGTAMYGSGNAFKF